MSSVAPLATGAQRVLIVCPSWIGDTIMATPVYRAFRERLSGAHLTALVRPGLEEILEGTSWFDDVIVARSGGVRGPLAMARAIRRARADAALLMPNSFGSALGVWLARVPRRIGYARDGRSVLLTERIAVEKSRTPQCMVPYYAKLACAALGTAAIDERVELRCSEAQHEAAERALPRSEIKSKLIILNPGANREDKRWPAVRFAQVGDALADSKDATVAVTGSPAEREVVLAVCSASKTKGGFVNLIERGIRLGSLKAIIERADMLITNDTGPRHIALAFGTPVVCMFGPTDHRWTQIADAPGEERRLLAEPFLPEEFIADAHTKACAIDRIPAGDVIWAATQLLHRERPRP